MALFKEYVYSLLMLPVERNIVKKTYNIPINLLSVLNIRKTN